MSNKDDWLRKAEIDYFSKFIPLWLAFNSWYRSHYPDLADPKDRNFIDKVKDDDTPRNSLFTAFKDLMHEETSKKGIKFRSDLEALRYSLNRVDLYYRKASNEDLPFKISFEYALIKYDNVNLADANSYEDITLALNARGVPKIKLSEMAFIHDHHKIFAALIEIIYQVRCYLFHGDLKPNKEEHEIIRYCYEVLKTMMDNLR